ncbi:MAG: signal peptidase I, partial [Lutimonas sp.]
MTLSQWLIFFLAVQVIHALGTWKLYVKAGRKAWESIVPIYNAIVLMQIINRPKWWVILLFIPIINLLMFPIVWIETIRSFGRNSRQDTWLVVLTLGFYIYYVNYALDVKYIENRSLKPRTAAGEWVSSIAFAVIAATLVHTYFMQPYTIPTSSLEKSLLIGDFLFVSKFHYGARVPMTTVAAPMVHDTLPLVKTRSYLNKPQLPYFRLPALQKIKQNDIVVFSWPVDTVEQFFKKTNRRIRKPIDKKSNYVKRCVGLPGDSLELRDGYVYINGKKNELPDRARLQFFYDTDTDGQPLSVKSLKSRYHVREGGQLRDGNYVLNLTQEDAQLLAKNPTVKSLE